MVRTFSKSTNVSIVCEYNKHIDKGSSQVKIYISTAFIITSGYVLAVRFLIDFCEKFMAVKLVSLRARDDTHRNL